ncbi:NUDIX domain-containing protein [Thauera sp. WH-2]|jgi:ADP-ribose pyrophosphatase|uniref:NUDIX domain-containing protein n=1 Tax=unclassified Thauera TaxID=2609274 RepID=UPI003AADDBD8
MNARQADDPLAEHTLGSEPVFDGRLLHVRRDRVRLPDGSDAIREYIRHPGAVVIVGMLDSGRLLFERQFRYPLRRAFVELPAGKLDAAEPPLACACRELREETGYEASTWIHLGVMHPCIGYSDERIEIFFAHGLTPGASALDEGEFLEVLELSIDEVERQIDAGEITDAKTITAFFRAQPLIRAYLPA